MTNAEHLPITIIVQVSLLITAVEQETVQNSSNALCAIGVHDIHVHCELGSGI